MATEIQIVAGWTSPLKLALQSGGEAYDLSGATAQLVVTNANGASVTMAGTVTVTSAAGGRLEYAPVAADFATAGVYSARVKVTDSGGKISFFPNKEPIRITVNA
jgi:hypothetical protein